jgi:acyl-CoA thioester hydrolase
MLEFQTTIRTRYAETDQMGYIYYAHYLTYLEVARTEAIKQIGISYRVLEDEYGIMLPVAEAHLDYKYPARYDDLLILTTKFEGQPTVKIRFDTDICHESGLLLAKGYVTLVFVNKQSMKPCRPPQVFIDALKKFQN